MAAPARCCKPDADYGFKRGLGIACSGMITYCPLLPARPHDINALDDLVDGFVGLVSADKGFIDAVRQALLQERQSVLMVTTLRKGMAARYHPQLVKAFQRIRTCVETVGSQLIERFAIARIHMCDLWHYQQHLIRKILAHAMVVLLNLPAGRPPLDLVTN